MSNFKFHFHKEITIEKGHKTTQTAKYHHKFCFKLGYSENITNADEKKCFRWTKNLKYVKKIQIIGSLAKKLLLNIKNCCRKIKSLHFTRTEFVKYYQRFANSCLGLRNLQAPFGTKLSPIKTCQKLVSILITPKENIKNKKEILIPFINRFKRLKHKVFLQITQNEDFNSEAIKLIKSSDKCFLGIVSQRYNFKQLNNNLASRILKIEILSFHFQEYMDLLSKLGYFKNLKILSLKSMVESFPDDHQFNEIKNLELLNFLEELTLNLFIGEIIPSVQFYENLRIPKKLNFIFLNLSDFWIDKTFLVKHAFKFHKLLQECSELKTFMLTINNNEWCEDSYDFIKKILSNLNSTSLEMIYLNLNVHFEINLSEFLKDIARHPKIERLIFSSESSSLFHLEVSDEDRYESLRSLHLTTEKITFEKDSVKFLSKIISKATNLNFLTLDCFPDYLDVDSFLLLCRAISNLKFLEFLSLKLDLYLISEEAILILSNFTKYNKLLKYRQITLNILEDQNNPDHWESFFKSDKVFKFDSILLKIQHVNSSK